MPIPKMLAGGLAASLALVGGGAIAHGVLDHSSNASTSPNATASARTIAANSTPSSIYNAAKDSVTYVQSALPQGTHRNSPAIHMQDLSDLQSFLQALKYRFPDQLDKRRPNRN